MPVSEPSKYLKLQVFGTTSTFVSSFNQELKIVFYKLKVDNLILYHSEFILIATQLMYVSILLLLLLLFWGLNTGSHP